MVTIHPQFIIDTVGNRLVIHPYYEYKNMLEDLD